MRLALRLSLTALLIVQGCLCALAAVPGSDTPPDLDGYAAQVLKEFEVPGLAVAIVKDGKVVLAKGYGVRKLGDASPVDTQTLFGIASNTKAFTAAALAMLVDEGKISWDDAVIEHLPSFQMYDPYVTRELTIRDLLTHRSGLGLGAGDLLFFPPSTYSREEIIRRLRFVKPATSFRSKYAYDNVLYLVAGEVIHSVTVKSWDDFVKERIFAPLGMTASNTSVSALRPGDNFATPHARAEGRVFAIEPSNLDNNAPAGSINSNVAEMAKWMIVQLDGGLIRDSNRRLFSERQSREMWSAQTILPLGDPPPLLAALKANFAAYGLGWGLTEYRGHKTVSHTGGLPGYVSRVTLVPDMKLGIVVLTNQEAGAAFQALTYHTLDHYLGASETDWITAYQTLTKQGEARAAEVEKKAKAARATDSRPSLDLSRYAGRYRDAWYGDVTISLENGKLVLRFSHSPALVGDMEHWQYDTFIARWRDRSLNADAYVTFALKPDGSIDRMKMAPVSPLTDFSYDFQDLLFAPAPPSPAERK
ncbi:MAG TPA: serine hydrolase [Blastocatellia bacterium]|nr:serine hydrolase [Blastocatellia bacterium]